MELADIKTSEENPIRKAGRKIICYLLIVLGCLSGAYFAGKTTFSKEIIFLAYCCLILYATVEMALNRVPFFKKRTIFFIFFFAAACFAVSFLALRTTDEMILQKELNLTKDKIQDTTVYISAPYVIEIHFTMSQKEFMDLAASHEFEPIEPWDFKPYTENETYSIGDYRGDMETSLYFSKSNWGDHSCPLSLKYIAFNAITSRVFYQHRNYRTVD